MTSIRLKLAPPWVTFVNEIKALFGKDPQVSVAYDNNEVEVKLYIDNALKAEAIEKILPTSKQFGNVELKITIIPSNPPTSNLDKMPLGCVFDVAFDGNPVYSFSRNVDSVFSNVLTYVVFKNEVVQFFNDNLNDIYGNVSTLYQEIASDVFEVGPSVFFCTDVKRELGAERQWI